MNAAQSNHGKGKAHLKTHLKSHRKSPGSCSNRLQTTLMVDPNELDRFKQIAQALNMSTESLLESVITYAAYSDDYKVPGKVQEKVPDIEAPGTDDGHEEVEH